MNEDITERRGRAKELRGLLFDADLTQSDIASEMGISQSLISQYLTARKSWPADFEPKFIKAVKALSKGGRRVRAGAK